MVISLAARDAISRASSCSSVDVGQLCTILGVRHEGACVYENKSAFVASLLEWASSAGLRLIGTDVIAKYLGTRYNCTLPITIEQARVPFAPYTQRLVDQARAKLHNVIDTTAVDGIVVELSKATSSSVVLHGPKGAGKHSAVLALANRIAQNIVPAPLLGSEIVEVDVAVPESRDVIAQLVSYANDNSGVIVYIRNISSIINMVSAEMLMMLLNSRCKKIVAITDDMYKMFASADTCGVFTPIGIKPASAEHTAQVLNSKVAALEYYHGVSIGQDAISAVVDAASRLPGADPGKSVSLLDAACVIAALSSQRPSSVTSRSDSAYSFLECAISKTTREVEHRSVNLSHIEQAMQAPRSRCAVIGADLARLIKQRVVGQDQAVEQLCADISTHATFNDGMRPASFMMIGSSSVGKTYTAEVLAEALGRRILVLDMANYTERHTISRLIGSPPGYVGYQEGGTLTNFIKDNPNCVVVFDELEKAHPEVHNVLLSILDRGRLSDMAGNTVSCSDCIFIMTGNIGTEILLSKAEYGLGFGSKKIDKVSMVIAEIKKTINPALVDRIGRFLVFNKLTKEHLYAIIDLELAKLITEQSPVVELDDLAKDAMLADWESGHGARSIKRKLLEPLALVAADNSKDKNTLKYTISHNGDVYYIKGKKRNGKRNKPTSLRIDDSKHIGNTPAAEAAVGGTNE